jgi:hypothetical protein
MSQQVMAMTLTTVGAGLAFAFTYIWVRRVFFRDQELQDAVTFSKGLPEAGMFNDEELQEAARVHFQSTFLISIALSVVGWAMFVLGLLQLQR